MAGLSERDRDFLAALADGETQAAYARRNSFGSDWARWKSREVRHKLGVDTIEEAIEAMGDDDQSVSKSDFDKLTGLVTRLGESLEEFARARPHEQPAAREQVQQRELDVKDHAKALGLSVEDIEKLKGEKEFARFREMQDRLDAERAEEGDDGVDDADANGAGKTLGEKVRDGLGGITGVKQPQ